jgi:hypothetical protein
MDEKIFKSMGRIGAANIAMGVVSIAVGLTVGILSIICGGNLLSNKKHMIF